MKKSRYLTKRDIVLSIGTLLIFVSIISVYIQLLGLEHGYFELLVPIAIVILLMFIDRAFVLKKYAKKCDAVKADLELKDVLYQLLEKTASYNGDLDFYNDILIAAIKAIENGHKGSIIDLRNHERIKYVAVEGFDIEVLEAMALGYEDTYLYKETKGALDRTVIIKNSVNYNQLHSNDRLVKSLIEAGTATVKSTLSTPIRLQGEVIGMINIDSSKKDAFSERDIKIIEIFALEVAKMIQYYEVTQENIYLSHYDAMTQIYNRGYFYERHRELYQSTPPNPYVFISTDIDNLKDVNDTYGHDVGDTLIKHFVDGIKGMIDEKAVFGRYGGDEFNLLLPDYSVSEAKALMVKANKYFTANPIRFNKIAIRVSYSYGIIKYPDEEIDYEKLIIKADQRMYEQKNMKGQKN